MKIIHRLLVAATLASLAIPLTASAVTMLVPVARSKAAKPAPEGLVGTMPVAFNGAELSAMGLGETALLSLPTGREYEVVLDRVDRHENGDVSWVGHFLEGGRDALAIVTMGAQGSYATLKSPDGEWGVVPGEGNDWLYDTAVSNIFVDRSAHETDALIHEGLAARSKAEPSCPTISSTPANVNIDVMHVMAPDFVTVHGGAANASTRLNFLVSSINSYYANSKIGITLRRAASVNVSFGPANGGPSDNAALDGVTNGTGAFAYIARLRDVFAADMVAFMRGPLSQGAGGTSISGLAWIGGGNLSAMSGSSGIMYSVSGDAPPFSGTLNAHEMGHNMGNNHDPANAGNNFGATSYAYGYTRCGTNPAATCPTTGGAPNAGTGGFGTIMSYWRPTIPRFSNPNDSTCNANGSGNVACSAAISGGSVASVVPDEVRTINCVRTDISNMRNSTRALDCADPTQDTDGDGLPNCKELALGRNPNAKDNDIFGVTLDTTLLFTLQQYRDFLGREADADGANYYMTQQLQGGLSRLQMIENFFNSVEFQTSGAPVVRLYFAFFNRIPDYAGFIFQTNVIKSGASINAVANNFSLSPEFQATYGSLNNTQYVVLLYQNVLGRTPVQSEIDFHVNRLVNQGASRGDVMAGFSESPEYIAARVNHVYVTMMYVGMLRRQPDQAGFDFWRNYIMAGNSGQALINGFYVSPEYHSRFVP